MSRRRNQAVVSQLRREGVRASAGPWSLYAGPAQAGKGRVTVALGRAAGQAVARSRLRRIARDVLAGRRDAPARIDLLLLARADVSGEPRRRVRATLRGLLARALAELTRRGGKGGSGG